jgi:hypothetical protein
MGATPAQAIHNLMSYMEGLANPATKQAALLEIAQRCGIDLNQYRPLSPQQQEIRGMKDYIQQQQQQQYQAQWAEGAKAAQTLVNDWAKDKPHFETVRGAMYELLSVIDPATGNRLVRLKPDGSLDLDSAYNMAVRLHRQTRDGAAELDKQAKAMDKKSSIALSKKHGKTNGTSKPRRQPTIADSLIKAVHGLQAKDH